VRGISICLEDTGRHRVSNPELWPIFKRFDKNNDDRISLEEFSSQFYAGCRQGSVGRSWYDNDMRMRHVGGRTIGQGPPVMSTNVMAARRIEDVICRISSAIVRTGFSPLQLFQKVDLDHNGRLSWTEIERVISSFQPDLSLSEKQSIFRRFDPDGSGDVDVNEFCSTLNGCNATALVNVEGKVKALGDRFRAQGQTVYDAFRVFDRNNDGFLTRDEWFRALRTFEWSLTEQDIDLIFSRFDVNGDGYMSITEFDTFFRDSIDRSPQYYLNSTNGAGATYGAPGNASYLGAGVGPVGGNYVNNPAGGIYGNNAIGGGIYGNQAVGGIYGQQPVMPSYIAPPVEQPWETEVLDTVRNCLSVGRSGMTITEVFRRLDIDQGGTMSPYEFQRMVGAYRQDLSTAHMDSLFRKVNTSDTGQIILSEFIRRFG